MLTCVIYFVFWFCGVNVMGSHSFTSSNWNSNNWNIVPTRSKFMSTTISTPAANVTSSIWEQDVTSRSSNIIQLGSFFDDFVASSTTSDVLSNVEENNENDISRGHKYKKKKLFKKMLLPLLLAYKLKFFTLIPVLIGGLVLLAGATGLAGFFFALFAATIGLSKTSHSH